MYVYKSTVKMWQFMYVCTYVCRNVIMCMYSVRSFLQVTNPVCVNRLHSLVKKRTYTWRYKRDSVKNVAMYLLYVRSRCTFTYFYSCPASVCKQTQTQQYRTRHWNACCRSQAQNIRTYMWKISHTVVCGSFSLTPTHTHWQSHTYKMHINHTPTYVCTYCRSY
jgi:hypothetical protein